MRFLLAELQPTFLCLAASFGSSASAGSGDHSFVMAVFYSRDLSWSIWLEVVKHVVGLRPTDGGNESLLDAPEKAQLHLHAGMHFIAAVGARWWESTPASSRGLSIGRHGWLVARPVAEDRRRAEVQPDVLENTEEQRTRRLLCVRVLHLRGLYQCERQESQGCDTCAHRLARFYAVVLAGTAFITVGDDCSALSAGSGYVFLPEGPLRVEVEGSTSMLFAYVEFPELGAGAPWSAAKKRAEQYCGEREKAHAEWQKTTKGRVRKRQRDEGDSGEQAVAEGPEVSGAQQTEARAANDPPMLRSDLIWPWKMGPWEVPSRQVVHRFAFGCRAISPSTRERWSKSLTSWREPWLQILWVYEGEDASLLEAQAHHPHLLIRDAGLVMPKADWAEWKARGFPIPLIKDLFQLQCLHLFWGDGGQTWIISCYSTRLPRFPRRRHGW